MLLRFSSFYGTPLRTSTQEFRKLGCRYQPDALIDSAFRLHKGAFS
jgi:hypothetical protein